MLVEIIHIKTIRYTNKLSLLPLNANKTSSPIAKATAGNKLIKIKERNRKRNKERITSGLR